MNSTQKRQLVWDWKKSCPAEKVVIPEKKRRQSLKKKDKNTDKYICLHCFELSLQGKMDEKCASICRIDPSSIRRHQGRWHTPPNQETCKFVPSNALDVQELRKKYAETENFQKSDSTETVIGKTSAIQADALQPQLEFALKKSLFLANRMIVQCPMLSRCQLTIQLQSLSITFCLIRFKIYKKRICRNLLRHMSSWVKRLMMDEA